MTDPNALLLESTASKIYRYLKENLKGGKKRRLDYNVIARTVGCTRSTVRYNLDQKLIPLGLVAVENGKLYLKK